LANGHSGRPGIADPRHLAFLRDRTLVDEGRKQVYGTQIYTQDRCGEGRRPDPVPL
jgi:hypothetical protein